MADWVECVVCGPDVGSSRHRVPEGMFGTDERFDYRECHGCGSLQIDEIPLNLSDYYDPSRYYSLTGGNRHLARPWLRRPPATWALALNSRLYLRSGAGRGFPWAREAGFRLEDRILDLGCGDGYHLGILHLLGFRHLTGADPFIPESTSLVQGVPLHKAAHGDVNGSFDWVMLHHAFEHVPDPRETLGSIRRLLAPGGRALIRMPVMGQTAWHTYGAHWAQIDPPRHLVLYTRSGFTTLAAEEGFRVERVFWDSDAFQFWGSELVASGRAHSTGSGSFSAEQMEGWRTQAAELNLREDGDQAGYVICAG